MERDFCERGGYVSDLACERRRADLTVEGVERTTECKDGFSWERIRINSTEGARMIARPIGCYDTLTLPRMDKLSEEQIDDAGNEIAKELCLAVERLGIYPERLLIVGLGNRDLTPDSIGPRVASAINATMHLPDYDRGLFYELECSEIAVLTPGVSSQSGMDSCELIGAVCDRIEPDAVIAVDALASASPSRLGTTVQISDTGIFPGSGIGASHGELTVKTTGVPVIAIGVPTVINARAFAHGGGDAGFDGMFVSPKEIDGIASAASRIIAIGINQAFGII